MKRNITLGLFILLLSGSFSNTLAQNPSALAASKTPTVSPVDSDEAKSSGTEMNIKNADISAIVRIFSKKAKRNYLLDENIKGKVSIYLPGKVSSDEAIKILDSVLALKGFTSVPISENLWKIVPSKDAKQSTIPTLLESQSEVTAAMVTRLLHMKYVAAEEVKQLITPLVSNDGLVNAYTGTNALIIIDQADNIRRLEKIIESVDVPFSDREMTIIPIKFAAAIDIAKKLEEILGAPSDQKGATEDGSGTALNLVRARLRDAMNASANSADKGRSPSSLTQPIQPGQGAGALGAGSGGSSQSGTVSAKARAPKIIPDERTNAIIIVADEDTTARVRALISQLDSSVDLSGNRFYVYRCQHANAEELAEVLSGLAGGGSGTSPTSTSTRNNSGQSGFGEGSMTGFGSSRASSSGSLTGRGSDRLSRQSRLPGQSRLSDTKKGVSGAQLGEDISITADPATNSLIISASKTDYFKIKELLQQLDIKRRQVLVEAMLLEVGLTNNTSLGTDFLASAGGEDGGVLAKSDFRGNLAKLLADPTQLADFAVAAASAGTLTLPGDITIPTQTVLLTAAQTNSNVNVLSSPNILATDNEPAEIVVGQNVPFLASVSSNETNLNNTFNQIDRQDVGITLRLTPQISSNDYVSLQIFTEVSNVVPDTASSSLGPTTTIRTSDTSVITKDGQMVVIGGLMSDDNTEGDSGVPFLKDIPILGTIFRGTSETKRRTNLLIFITPRIVKDQFDARELTIDKRDRLEDEVDRLELEPKREEVLHNNDIDQVAEVSAYEGPKPSTIRGSKEVEELRPEQQMKSSLQLEPKIADRKETIELSLSPKLPSAPSKKDSAPLSNALAMSQPSKTTGAVYIIMNWEDQRAPVGSLPWQVFKDGTFAVQIPAESLPAARDFFKVGQPYYYLVGSDRLKVKPVAVFNTQAEADKELKRLSKGSDPSKAWYTLSPYELLNLGAGPWFTKEK